MLVRAIAFFYVAVVAAVTSRTHWRRRIRVLLAALVSALLGPPLLGLDLLHKPAEILP